jgi:mRNA-degrading endonuclease RelE of RelBE toxin-antitoxin system
MTPRHSRFSLTFAPEVVAHLAVIAPKYHSLIKSALKEQLSFTPDNKTRNRKLLEQPAPFHATWELRFGPNNRFRAFYEVDGAGKIVYVLAVGIKEGNRLLIGGEEFRV